MRQSCQRLLQMKEASVVKKVSWAVSPAIDGHYKVVNTDSPILHSKIGDIDFRSISLEAAEKLFQSGTRYLEKVKAKKKVVIKEAPTE